MCTTPSTRAPSTELIKSHAEAAGRQIELISELRENAYQELIAGDRKQHDSIVSEAALDLAGRCDVVVLAQASLAHLAPILRTQTPVPVLASPELCVDSLARWLCTGADRISC